MSAPVQILNRKSLRAAVLLERAELWESQDDWDQAEALYTEAVALDDTLSALMRYGQSLFCRGRRESAIDVLSGGLAKALRDNDEAGAALIHQFLSEIHRDQGEFAQARSHQQQAIACQTRAKGSPDNSPGDFSRLALDALSRGELDVAEQYAKIAVQLSVAETCPKSQADAWNSWAAVRFESGDATSAWRGFLKAYRLRICARDKDGIAGELIYLARCAQEFNDWNLNQRILRKAKSVVSRCGNRRWLSLIDHWLEKSRRVLDVENRTPGWN